MVLLGLIGLGCFFTFRGCEAGAEEARAALDAHGLTHVELGGAHAWSCDRGETSRRFTATNATGKRVSGVVCCGLIGKACTVRW